MKGKFFKVTKSKDNEHLGKIGILVRNTKDDGDETTLTVLYFGNNEHGIFFHEPGVFAMEEITHSDDTFNENAQLSIKEYQDEFIKTEKALDRIIKNVKKY